jgi:DNA-binding CsgD family transcriptional regulator
MIGVPGFSEVRFVLTCSVSFFRPSRQKEDFMESDTPSTPHLTARQKQIINLIAEDMTAKQIGARLQISPKTVEFHRDIIKTRLGVVGTAGIVRYAIRAGLLEP